MYGKNKFCFRMQYKALTGQHPLLRIQEFKKKRGKANFVMCCNKFCFLTQNFSQNFFVIIKSLFQSQRTYLLKKFVHIWFVYIRHITQKANFLNFLSFLTFFLCFQNDNRVDKNGKYISYVTKIFFRCILRPSFAL